MYSVNITVYCWERDHNKAYRQSDGNIEFDSDSSELLELVLRLIADGEVKVDPKDHNSDPVFESSIYINNLRSNSVPTPPVIDTDVITDTDRGNSDNPGMSDWVPNPDSESEMGPASEKQVDGGFFSETHNATNEGYKQRIRESAAGTTLPRTKWTKTKVLDTAIHSGVPEDKLEILSCMNLKDIHASLLVYDRTDITGNKYDSKQQRHTKFYRLRIDDILKLERNRHRNDTPLR